MEKKFQIKPVMVHLYCDKCANVEMVEESVVSNYYRTHYNYVCPKCGAKVISEVAYPHVEQIETNVPVIEAKTTVKDILNNTESK